MQPRLHVVQTRGQRALEKEEMSTQRNYDIMPDYTQGVSDTVGVYLQLLGRVMKISLGNFCWRGRGGGGGGGGGSFINTLTLSQSFRKQIESPVLVRETFA